MHRCLSIPEIQDIICLYLNDPLRRFPMRNYAAESHLVSWALACKTLHNVAIDHIWQDLHDFVPLIRTLPEGSWEQNTVEEIEKRISLKRKLMSTDLDRMRHYGKRVKRISGYPLCPAHRITDRFFTLDEPLQLELCQLLSQPQFSDISILPNLLKLSLKIGHNNIFPLALQLLHPAPLLKELRVTFLYNIDPHDLPCLAKLSSIVASSTKLSHLEVFAPSLEIKEQISDAVLRSSSLTALRVGPVNSEALAHISRLPHLVYLTIKFTGDPESGLGKSIFPLRSSEMAGRERLFLSLRYLTIEARNLDCIFGAIDLLSDHPIRHIEAIVSDPQETQPWELLLQKMCSGAINVTALRTIHCAETFSKEAADSFPAPHIISNAVFESLFSFANITDIHFTTSSRIIIDNELLKRMALAWPELASISIYEVIQRSGADTAIHFITLPGLIPLRHHCHNLYSLCLSVDATTIGSHLNPTSRFKPPGIAGWRSTKEEPDEFLVFKAVDSPIEDPFAVAAYLSAVFPCVRLMPSVDDILVPPGVEDVDAAADRERMNSYWKMVGNLIPKYEIVREQEKRLLKR